MKDKEYCDCNDKICKKFYDGYDEDDDNYVIQRLENIISICEFLIEHEKNKRGKKVLDDILDKAEKEAKSKKSSGNKVRMPNQTFPVYRYYKYPKPWWTDVWF